MPTILKERISKQLSHAKSIFYNFTLIQKLGKTLHKNYLTFAALHFFQSAVCGCLAGKKNSGGASSTQRNSQVLDASVFL